MAVYFVTGKLGGGKSLMSVSKLRDYLLDNRVVATNMDLRLHYLINRNARQSKVMRVPDRPTSADLLAIGRGNNTKDETRNGGLFLDECGVWFNTRNWSASGRQDIINFLLMARKLGWDVFLMVQNISLIDKQARDSIAEFVVYCSRMDKIHIPFISSIYKFLTGSKLPLPKIHNGIVKMGTSLHGIKSDHWTLYGTDLYSAYDTNQIFLQDCEGDAAYSYLPPAYYCNLKPLTLRQKMKLTRIYFKRWKRLPLILLGAVFGLIISSYYSLSDFIVDKSQQVILADTSLYSDYWIDRHIDLPGQSPVYYISDGNQTIDSKTLIARGYYVFWVSSCHIYITDVQNTKPVDLKCKEGL